MKTRIENKVDNLIKVPILGLIIKKILICIFLLYIKMRFIFSKKNIFIPVEIAQANIKQKRNHQTLTLDIKNEFKESRYDLSIIVPVYNVENYIVECLNSILDQKTKYNYEVIIINDGSTDNSSSILSKYSKYNNIKIIHQKNKGLSAARNSGLKKVEGKYIMFLDSDDMLTEGAIDIYLNIAYQTNSDIVEANFERFTNSKKINLLKINNYDYKIIDLHQKPYEIMNCKGFAWGKLYRREMWEGIQFPEGYLYEDTIVKYILLRKCRVYSYSDFISYRYRINKNSISFVNKKNYRSLDTLLILQYLLDLNDSLDLMRDEVLYRITLNQLGKVLYNRIYKLDRRTCYEALVIAKNLLDSLEDCKPSTLNSFEREIYDAITNLNYAKWQYVCSIR